MRREPSKPDARKPTRLEKHVSSGPLRVFVKIITYTRHGGKAQQRAVADSRLGGDIMKASLARMDPLRQRNHQRSPGSKHEEVGMTPSKQETKGEARKKVGLPEETREHLRAARKEMREGIEALLPPDFVAHRRAARREILMAAQSVIQHALERLEA
jgi:hypothetical protein